MADKDELDRFVNAQRGNYEIALEEVKNGLKRSHWMWYVFPQIHGLGFSSTAQFYAIKDLQEAADYLGHPTLGARLLQICELLIRQQSTNASKIFGHPDDLKLHSSMTLFAEIEGAHPIFEKVLEKFFSGEKDDKTLAILNKQT